MVKCFVRVFVVFLSCFGLMIVNGVLNCVMVVRIFVYDYEFSCMW